MKLLITGCAGFIGSHLCEFLLKRGDIIYGIDNINDYYDVSQKEGNLEILNKYQNFHLIKGDFCDNNIFNQIEETIDAICHLGAMAGVRYSIECPQLYANVNIIGTINLLEYSRQNNIKRFIYASSSSVYGLNTKIPFSEDDQLKKVNSPYAASKLCTEIYANLYHKLYDINTIGLRFFTVYGPRGRPDMAPFKFLKAILSNKPITKFGDGNTQRDYTYIDDIVSGIVASIDKSDKIKNEIYNLGNNNSISLNTFIETCEKVCEQKAIIIQEKLQKGDVPITYANIDKSKKDLDYNPQTNIFDGLTKLKIWMENNK